MEAVLTEKPAHIPDPDVRSLAHIPGSSGWPMLGHTLQILADPKGFTREMARRFGPVYRVRVFGMHNVALLGPEANELVMLDQGRNFSSAMGWGPLLDRVFPRGLMLLDFDEHRLHRRALSVAFKAGPMQSYLALLNRGIGARIGEWAAAGGEMRFYPAIKQLTLDLAATAFLGEEIGNASAEIQRAFIDMVAASIGIVRAPLPGTRMARGVRGRAAIVAYFSARVPERRERGGEDLFSHLCRATYEDGSLLSVRDIVDHMSFFMMAAHDTLTSSLSSFVQLIATHPEWQERLRAEVEAVPDEEGLAYTRLDSLPETEMAFKETMRIHPPVTSIPRRTVRELTFRGFRIPAGTRVTVNALFTHNMPEIWPEPERFDPLRFTEAASRARHRYAYVPFGGGAHMCLGLHFAYMQAKCFAWHLLRRARVSLPPGYTPEWQMWPIPKPRDGLRVVLAPRAL